MSDIDVAITYSKKLESLLEKKLGATGRGLHEKVSSVETRLSPDLIRKLRRVATVRNKIVHEADYQKIDHKDDFVRAAKEAEKELKAMGGGSRKPLSLVAIIILIIAAIVVLKFVLHW